MARVNETKVTYNSAIDTAIGDLAQAADAVLNAKLDYPATTVADLIGYRDIITIAKQAASISHAVARSRYDRR